MFQTQWDVEDATDETPPDTHLHRLADVIHRQTELQEGPHGGGGVQLRVLDLTASERVQEWGVLVGTALQMQMLFTRTRREQKSEMADKRQGHFSHSP